MPAANCGRQSSSSTVTAMPGNANHSHGVILQSTALIGAASVMNVLLGFARTKVLAVLLGPAGVGLWGLYGAFVDLAQSLVGLGVNSSGVRQIAEAVGSGDGTRIARTARVLRRTSVALGLIAIVSLVVFSRQISVLTFGSESHAVVVALLSLAVFLQLVAAAYLALIQGTRRIADLAMAGISGGVVGTAVTITAVYVFREDGLVPALIGIAAAMLLSAWWYGRRTPIAATPWLTLSDAWREAVPLLKLGVAFLSSALITMGVAYAVRIAVLHVEGFEAAGLYQAAWTLGGLYVGFILQAMGTDFYPRLTAAGRDDARCNHLVNEQARVSVVLAGPGIVGTVSFAPVMLSLLYSSSFAPATELLRWISLGMMLRILSWPMGYIILARAEQGLFIGTEAAWAIVHVALAWICLSSFGLNGAGMAFFGSYVFHVLLIFAVVRKRYHFRWSPETLRSALVHLALTGVVFVSALGLPPGFAVALGLLALAAGTMYSLRVLVGLVALDRWPSALRPFLRARGPSADGRPTVSREGR